MTLPEFSQVTVLVAGDIMLDRYWNGSTSRISPEAPVPVVKQQHSEDRLGGAANVALNLRAMGVSVGLCGALGDDQAGAAVTRLLAENSINNDCITDSAGITITKLRVLSRNQQLLRVDTEEPLPALTQQRLLDHGIARLNRQNALLLSDYNKGSFAAPQTLIQKAKLLAIPVLVDPKGNDYRKYAGATLLTPNRAELEEIVGPWSSDGELHQKAESLRADLDLEALLVTLSERGMLLVQSGAAPLHLPAKAREVYDVTGAGDTVIAMLAACIGSGMPIAKAANIANIAAAIVVGKLGTASVSPAELTSALQSVAEHQQSVITQSQLLDKISVAKAAGETVVMTNGCFDLLHPGHLAYLEEAATLGDRLIVAVNSDSSVKLAKGENRPINSLQDRMRMLAAIKGVDWVAPFDEETPRRLIAQALPHVLVKGGDYRPEDIAGYAEVMAAGGHVQILRFMDGYSSTALIDRIKAS